jgi:hypothetical protein
MALDFLLGPFTSPGAMSFRISRDFNGLRRHFLPGRRRSLPVASQLQPRHRPDRQRERRTRGAIRISV